MSKAQIFDSIIVGIHHFQINLFRDDVEALGDAMTGGKNLTVTIVKFNVQ